MYHFVKVNSAYFYFFSAVVVVNYRLHAQLTNKKIFSKHY